MTPAALIEQVQDWRRAAVANRLFWRALLGAAAVIGVDQASKHWIVNGLKLPERVAPCALYPDLVCAQIDMGPIFDLTFVRNFGASFGMLAGGAASRVFLSLLSLTIAGFLIAWLGRLTRPVAATGVAFVVGGALGNLIDRVRYGYVVDFLDFSKLYFPWVFNVADVAINIGVAFLLLDAYLTRDRPPSTAPKSGEGN